MVLKYAMVGQSVLGTNITKGFTHVPRIGEQIVIQDSLGSRALFRVANVTTYALHGATDTEVVVELGHV